MSNPSLRSRSRAIGGSGTGTRARSGRRWRALALAEPGGDHGDAHLVAHRVVDHGAEDDHRVRVGRGGDDLGGLVHLEQPDVVGRR